jgi:hypothetical protein
MMSTTAADGGAKSGIDSGADYAERMRRIQLGFIDDPRKAALDANQLAGELVQACADELTRRRRELTAEPGNDQIPDTERLRQAVRRYREFIDTLAQTMSGADEYGAGEYGADKHAAGEYGAGEAEHATSLNLPDDTASLETSLEQPEETTYQVGEHGGVEAIETPERNADRPHVPEEAPPRVRL